MDKVDEKDTLNKQIDNPILEKARKNLLNAKKIIDDCVSKKIIDECLDEYLDAGKMDRQDEIQKKTRGCNKERIQWIFERIGYLE